MNLTAEFEFFIGTPPNVDTVLNYQKKCAQPRLFQKLKQVTSTLLKPPKAANQDWGEVVGFGSGVDLPKPAEVFGVDVGFGLSTSTAGAGFGSAD